MPDQERRLESLESELKLVKGEIKRTLVDLRSMVMKAGSPFQDGPFRSSKAPAETHVIRESAERPAARPEAEAAAGAQPAPQPQGPAAAGAFPGSAAYSGFVAGPGPAMPGPTVMSGGFPGAPNTPSVGGGGAATAHNGSPPGKKLTIPPGAESWVLDDNPAPQAPHRHKAGNGRRPSGPGARRPGAKPPRERNLEADMEERALLRRELDRLDNGATALSDIAGTGNVNLIGNLMRWVATALECLGHERMDTLLDLYMETGHQSPGLKEMVSYVVRMLGDLGDTGRSELLSRTPAQLSNDLLLQLHGILTAQECWACAPMPHPAEQEET